MINIEFSNTENLLHYLDLMVKKIGFSILKPKTCKVLLVGLDCSGKSTALYKLKLDQVFSVPATIGYNFEEYTYKQTTFNFWDVRIFSINFRLEVWIKLEVYGTIISMI